MFAREDVLCTKNFVVSYDCSPSAESLAERPHPASQTCKFFFFFLSLLFRSSNEVNQTDGKKLLYRERRVQPNKPRARWPSKQACREKSSKEANRRPTDSQRLICQERDQQLTPDLIKHPPVFPQNYPFTSRPHTDPPPDPWPTIILVNSRPTSHLPCLSNHLARQLLHVSHS